MGEDVSLNYGLHCLIGFYFIFLLLLLFFTLNEMYMEGIGLYLVF